MSISETLTSEVNSLEISQLPIEEGSSLTTLLENHLVKLEAAATKVEQDYTYEQRNREDRDDGMRYRAQAELTRELLGRVKAGKISHL